jgi:membrane protease YdiL (CAAX protease family)
MRLRVPPVTAFVLGLLVFVIAQKAFRGLSGIEALQSPLLKGYGLKTILVALSLGFMVVERCSRRGRRWREFGWCLPRATALDWLIAVGLGSVTGAVGSMLIVLTPAKGMAEVMGTPSLLHFLLAVCLWSSVTEEIFTRGLVQAWMDEHQERGLRLGRFFLSWPVIASGLLFGCLHFTVYLAGCDVLTTVIVVSMTTTLGLIAAYYRQRTKSLALPILAHIAANLGGLAGGIIAMILKTIFGG